MTIQVAVLTHMSTGHRSGVDAKHTIYPEVCATVCHCCNSILRSPHAREMASVSCVKADGSDVSVHFRSCLRLSAFIGKIISAISWIIRFALVLYCSRCTRLHLFRLDAQDQLCRPSLLTASMILLKFSLALSFRLGNGRLQNYIYIL